MRTRGVTGMDHSLPLLRWGMTAGGRRTRRVAPVAVGRVWLVVVTGAVLLLAVGCGSPAADPGQTPVATEAAPSASPSPADPDQERAALAAYEGMWAVYDRAGRAPAADPDYPQLAEYAAGDALDGLRTALGRLRDEGLVFEGSYVSLSPTVVELSPVDAPTTAKVEDCRDSSGWVVVRADGGEYEDEPGGRRAVFADVERADDGVWRVTSFAVQGVGTC